MNTPLLQKLREHLASITKEEFQEEWAQIEAKNLEGPTMEEFLKSLVSTPVFSTISSFKTVNSQVSDEFVQSSFTNPSYLLAA